MLKPQEEKLSASTCFNHNARNPFWPLQNLISDRLKLTARSNFNLRPKQHEPITQITASVLWNPSIEISFFMCWTCEKVPLTKSSQFHPVALLKILQEKIIHRTFNKEGSREKISRGKAFLNDLTLAEDGNVSAPVKTGRVKCVLLAGVENRNDVILFLCFSKNPDQILEATKILGVTF